MSEDDEIVFDDDITVGENVLTQFNHKIHGEYRGNILDFCIETIYDQEGTVDRWERQLNIASIVSKTFEQKKFKDNLVDNLIERTYVQFMCCEINCTDLAYKIVFTVRNLIKPDDKNTPSLFITSKVNIDLYLDGNKEKLANASFIHRIDPFSNNDPVRISSAKNQNGLLTLGVLTPNSHRLYNIDLSKHDAVEWLNKDIPVITGWVINLFGRVGGDGVVVNPRVSVGTKASLGENSHRTYPVMEVDSDTHTLTMRKTKDQLFFKITDGSSKVYRCSVEKSQFLRKCQIYTRLDDFKGLLIQKESDGPYYAVVHENSINVCLVTGIHYQENRFDYTKVYLGL